MNAEILNTTWEGMVIDTLAEFMQDIPSNDTLEDIANLLKDENTILGLIYDELAVREGN